MAQKKRKKQTSPVTPTGVHYTEKDGDFYLYKKWSKTKISSEPFFITDDIANLIEEIERRATSWKLALNLKDLKKFINKHKQDGEPSIP